MSYEAFYRECRQCPRKCGVDRTTQTGFCRESSDLRLAFAGLHFGEEPLVTVFGGSGTIFFTGCTLRCAFCQNYQISAMGQGRTITVRELSEHIKRLEDMGVHNINLVSPTPYIDSIIEALEIYRPSIPVVYNTGGYERTETLKRLEGIVDIYLPDLKYVSSEKAAKYSGAADYPEYALAAIEEMVRQTGTPVLDDDGIMQRGTIVRHLILPSNTKSSVEVIKQLDKSFGDKILISLMGQYTPQGRAQDYPEINRTITRREYYKVLSALEETSLDGFAQQLSSASSRYIPDFDIM